MLATVQACRGAEHNAAKLGVLIDGALLRDATPRTRRRWKFDTACSLFPPGTADTAVQVGPLLFEVPMNQIDTETVESLFDAGTGQLLGSFVVTASHEADLVQALRHFVDVQLDDGTEMVMRFYDPRILPFWLGGLPDVYRRFLGAAISHWIYWTENLEVRVSRLVGSPVDTLQAAFPLRLSAQREADLIDASTPYLVMNRLVSEQPGRLARIPRAHRYEFIRIQLERARMHGLASLSDLEAYCGLAATLGEQFDSDPTMKGELLKVSAGATFLQVISNLTSSDWQRMREAKQ
jgi:hypothetical protein